MTAIAPSEIHVSIEPAPATTAAPGRRMTWSGVFIFVWVIAYAVFLATRFVPALSEPDDNGYFAQGSLLAQTGRTWFTPESDAQYVGMHWLLTPDGKYVSRYPPGLAVVIAGLEKIGGWRAAAVTNPLFAIAGVVGFYLLSRRLLGSGWALSATVVLSLLPEYVHHGLGFDSHTGVALCVIWGLYLLVRWSQEGRIWQAFLAGVVLGCVPTIRYPDVVVGAGVAAFLLSAGWRRWRHVMAAVAGALIPVTALAVRNHLVMGAFWRTGYALTNEQTGFGLDYFRQHAIDYVRQLNASGVGPMFALGFVGIVWMICTPARRRLGTMLAGIVLPMMLLYMAYYWAPQGGVGSATMRFMVPIFAPLVLAGMWVLAEVTRTARAGQKVAVAVAVVTLQLLWGTGEMWQQTGRVRGAKESLARVTSSLEHVAAPGSVVIGDQNVLQHLDYVRTWKLADASLIRGGRFGGPGGGPGGPGGPGGMDEEDRPSPRQAEKEETRRAKYTGTQDRREDKFAADVLAWAGGQKVYFVGGEEEMRSLMGSGKMRVVERIKLPDQPETGRGGMGGGMGMGGRQPQFGGGGPGMMGGGRRFAGGPGMGGGMMGRPGMGGMAGGPGGPGGGGGMMGGFAGLKEVVIAEWVRG